VTTYVGVHVHANSHLLTFPIQLMVQPLQPTEVLVELDQELELDLRVEEILLLLEEDKVLEEDKYLAEIIMLKDQEQEVVVAKLELKMDRHQQVLVVVEAVELLSLDQDQLVGLDKEQELQELALMEMNQYHKLEAVELDRELPKLEMQLLLDKVQEQVQASEPHLEVIQ
jgi:hypothetical protein